MKRLLSPSNVGRRRQEEEEAAKRHCARISFAACPIVYTVDCSFTTRNLFYTPGDIRTFRQDYLIEEKEKTGDSSLHHLVMRKRRQKAMQRETLAEFMRKNKIERRIQEIISTTSTTSTNSSNNTFIRMRMTPENNFNDICFRQRYIPVPQHQHHTCAALQQTAPPPLKKKPSIAHAA